MCSVPLTISFEEVKAFEKGCNVLLIDVREPTELKEAGVIPGSINIPLDDFEKTLRDVTPEEFKRVYGRDKPDKTFPIVVSCRSGRRSMIAYDAAQKLGFQNVRNYAGGWLDWEKMSKEGQ